MKKIKILLLSLSILITFNVFPAELDVRFADVKISGGNLVFDIEIKSDVGNTYLSAIDIYFNYNTVAFGSSIYPANITVTPIDLLDPVTTPGYTITVANSSSSRISVNAFNIFPTFFAAPNVLTTYAKVFNVSIPIVDATENAGISFECSFMAGSSFYYPAPNGGTATAYSPINCMNDLLLLPLNPNVDLMLSELGIPSDAGVDFVEIYNAGASTVDFDGYFAWYLNINGVASMLTGMIAPGEAFVVDITGSNGNVEYILSTYGDYLDGDVIDVYDGTVTGYDFTGKHAVRHYNIISPNTTFTPAEWVISPAEDIDMTAGSHRATVNWSGATAEWRNQANWAEGLIPDAAHNVVIPNTGTSPLIVNGTNAYGHDLSIGDIGLVIESDAIDGDGSLITYGAVTGTASVQRYLAADRYWYVTQPVTSAVAGVFLHLWMFTFDEPAGSWAPFIEDETTPLNVMQGYAIWTSSSNSWNGGTPIGDTTVAYTGTLNTGDLSKNLTYNFTGDPDIDGWNFAGNPYPSALDWEAMGWTKTNLTNNAFSVWNGVNYGTYTVGSGGTNGATRYIPAAQGFFVNANAAGTLGVSNMARTHSTQSFWKNQENMLNRLSMIVSNGAISDETVIYFNEEASADMDYLFDARKLMAPAVPQAYTMMGSSKMAINTHNNIAQTPSVKLGINAPEAGEYTLTAANIESFDAGTPIYLEDLSNGTVVNLRETGTYTFSAPEGTAERFNIHFTFLGIGDDPASAASSIYALNRQVYVDFTATKGEISVYNILGQEVSRTGASNGLNILSVPQGNAVYIVKVVSDNSTVTKKVFVK